MSEKPKSRWGWWVFWGALVTFDGIVDIYHGFSFIAIGEKFPDDPGFSWLISHGQWLAVEGWAMVAVGLSLLCIAGFKWRRRMAENGPTPQS